MRPSRIVSPAIALLAAALLAGCSNMSSTEQRMLSGGAIGTGTGAVIGAMTGGLSIAAGAAIGAVAGAAGGYIVDQAAD